jgi:Tol biopolymer transport system component
MSTDRFDHELPVLLEKLAEPRIPDYYDDLFSQTAHTSQRPAWTFLERWLPMLEIARRPVAPRMPWQPIVVLLVLVGALAAGLLLAAARPKLPPLIGPAANGLVVTSRDGDILTIDPRTGVTAVIVGGPEIDSDPLWSQDGTRLIFRRAAPDQPEADLLMIARANGSGVKRLTPEPMTGLTSAKVSPIFAPALRYALSSDGLTVAMISTVNGIPALFVGDTDARAITRLDIPAIPLGAAFDPTGKEILFVGAQGFDGSYAGLYVIGVDGSNLRTLIEPRLDAQIWSKVYWSPDGTRIAYGRREPGFAVAAFEDRLTPIHHDLRVHVIAADGTDDRIVGHEEGAWWEAPTGWSPDGRRLLIERSITGDAVGAPFEAAIIDVDGHAPDLVPQFTSQYDWFAVWSPDGTTILATPSDSDGNGLQQELWDTRTGEAKPAPWAATSFPSWQRVAP